MSRSLLFSVVALIPLVGIGGVMSSKLHQSPPTPAVTSPASIDVDEIQSRIDARTLPEQKVADYI